MAEFNYEGFWDETLRQLRIELGEGEFSAWFTDIKYIKSQENSVVIGFPSSFHRDRIKTRYQNSIRAKLKELAGGDIALEFEVIPGDTAPVSENSPAAAPKNLDSHAVNREIPAEKPKKGQHPQMRDDYTFEKYIIGENNNFAANAAIAISRNPGTSYNPFLIYGGVGLGKTHLMQAIGNYIHENSSHKVLYVTSEDFLNEYVQAIRDKEMPAFKNKFRYTDVLLIDDIQFFQEKEQIQEEFFHTFNTLLNAKKQLVMTCDRPPSELKKFSDRLISRFEQSLRVDLQPPRYEVRCAILKSTAESRGAVIPDEVIDLISKNVSSNIRDLIGALKTLISYTEIMGQPVTLEIAQQKLRDVFASRRQANLSIEIIQKVVADFFSLNSSDLKGKKKTQKIVYPRQISMHICREMTDFSTTEIGEAFGGRDHTTVMHSIDKIQGLLLTDPTLDSTMENLKRQIKESSAKL
ncbi:MAG: chromosomal replication initiator protein DnaA [Treponema sp.]|jgi:chromosomal replication initiator protein|nr:chromosomal replication initiator protein DnaA [Treponema sp.]